MTPTYKFQFMEVKKWFKQYEACLNSKDFKSAHVLAHKIAFWIIRLPEFEREALERMYCNK